LTGVAAAGVLKHQVFDLPPTPLVVTEHQMESKGCPQCGVVTRAPPPPGAGQPTQYGPRLAALAIYLHSAHFIPLQRTADVIAQLTGRRVSEGWIETCHARLSATLEPFLSAVTAGLRAAKVVCCDETGFRFAARRFWLHVCCTGALTLLLCHRRRGAEGIAALGILPTPKSRCTTTGRPTSPFPASTPSATNTMSANWRPPANGPARPGPPK